MFLFRFGSKKDELDMSDPAQISRTLDDNWKSFDSTKGVAQVIEAMTKHRHAAAVQESGCGALMKLALSEKEECRHAILSGGGVEAILQAMSDHSDREGVQQFGAGVLGNLAQGSAAASRDIGKRGGVDAVLHALRQGSAGTLERSLLALANLASNSNDNRSAIAASRFEGDGVTLAVGTMRDHPKDAGIQSWGCALLANLAGCEIAPQAQALQEHICRAGGIEVVLAAMCGHRSNAAVQQRGCLALGNATSKGVECCVAQALQGGAVEALIAAMRAHAGSEKVQARATVALANIAFEDEHAQASMEAAGGIDAVLAAMKAHRKVCAVQRDGCCFIATSLMLARGTAVPAEKIAAKLTAVLAAMAAHPENIDVQKWGCVAAASSAAVFATGGNRGATAEIFLRGNGPELVSAAIVAFSKAPELDKWAADALTAFTRVEPVQVASRTLGARGMEGLTTLLTEQKAGDTDVTLAVLECLNMLCEASEACSRRFLALNGKDILAKVASHSCESVDIVCWTEKLNMQLDNELRRNNGQKLV